MYFKRVSDKHHIKNMVYIRKENLSYRLCILKKDRKNIIKNICELAILASEQHKIDENFQKNIYEYYLRIKKAKFQKVFKNSTMDCDILCEDKIIEFTFSRFELQPILENSEKKLSFVHRKINGIFFPLTFRLTNDNIKGNLMVYTRIVCNSLNNHNFIRHNLYSSVKKKKIEYWSESFIGRSYLDCPQSSLSIDDCNFGYIENDRDFFSYKLGCSVKYGLNTTDDKHILMKKG